MNTPSPLLPQGAVPPKAKSSIYFKILMVLGIHVVVIGGLLLQGCKETPKDQVKDGAGTTTTTVTPDPAPNNTVPAPAPADTSSATVAPTAATVPAPVAQPPPVTPPAATPTVPPATTMTSAPTPATTLTAAPAMTGGREYVIAQGDTLAAIAHKNGVSLRSLQDANAGVNPRKLRVGQKLQIPAGSASGIASAASPMAAATATDVAAPSGDAMVYVVKPGDTLSRIAKAHGTRFKAIMEINDMKTTSIRVGQKLKLPSKMASAEMPATTPAAQTASTPAIVPTPAPATSTAAN